MMVKEFIDPALIDLDTSQPKRYNPSKDEHVQNLKLVALQLAEVGQEYPVLVSPYVQLGERFLLGHEAENYCIHHPETLLRFFCIDGEKRTRSARDILNWSKLWIERKYDLDLYHLYKIQWITCGKRIELNAADYADALIRWRDEFLKQFPDKNENDALNEIARLTGYSLSYVHGRNLLNMPEIGEEAKQLVREDKLKINDIIELQRLEPEFAKIALDHEIEKAKRRESGELADTTPLRFRNIKHQQDRLTELVKEKKLTKEEKHGAVVDLIYSGGRSDGKGVQRDAKGNFARYKAIILSWYDRESKFNIDDLSVKEIDNLAGLLTDMVTLFQNMQAEKLKTSNLKKTKGIMLGRSGKKGRRK